MFVTQGPRAEAMMRSAMERGKWVFFQNCHLAPSWMPTLERLIEQIDPDKVRERACQILYTIVSMYKYQNVQKLPNSRSLMFSIDFCIVVSNNKARCKCTTPVKSVSLLIVYFVLISRDR